MGTHPLRPRPVFFILTLLLLAAPLPSDSFFFAQYQTLFSLSHSVMARVANLRVSRGDAVGASRARLIAEKLERGRGLGFIGFMSSIGWDYARNYAWRDLASFETFGALSDINELMKFVNELTRLDSHGDRAAWVQRNYSNTLRVLKSLFTRLLNVFAKPGPLKELVTTMQREIIDGELLKDCLEIGSNDLKGLTQIFGDIILQFSPSSSSTYNSDL